MVATGGAHKYVGVYRIHKQFEYTKRNKKGLMNPVGNILLYK